MVLVAGRVAHERGVVLPIGAAVSAVGVIFQAHLVSAVGVDSPGTPSLCSLCCLWGSFRHTWYMQSMLLVWIPQTHLVFAVSAVGADSSGTSGVCNLCCW